MFVLVPTTQAHKFRCANKNTMLFAKTPRALENARSGATPEFAILQHRSVRYCNTGVCNVAHSVQHCTECTPECAMLQHRSSQYCNTASAQWCNSGVRNGATPECSMVQHWSAQCCNTIVRNVATPECTMLQHRSAQWCNTGVRNIATPEVAANSYTDIL